MTTDLDLRLRAVGDDLHVDVPLADVLVRGARIRRRRQSVRLAVAGTALAATAGVATIGLPPGASPLPSAEAGWGQAMVNLSGADLDTAEATCRATLAAEGHDLPAEAAPVAADSRDGNTVLVYHVGDTVDTCVLSNEEGAEPWVTEGPWDMIPAGHDLEHVATAGPLLVNVGKEAWEEYQAAYQAEHGVPAPEPDEPDVAGTIRAMRVSEDVSDVVLHVGDRDVQARIADGLAVTWLPDGSTVDDQLAATVSAYAEDGTELDRVLLNVPFVHITP